MTEIIVAAFATWQIVEIWHHSSLFASWRARVELWEGFFGELLMCPFCLSIWVAALCVILMNLPWWCGGQLLVAIPAVARLANLGNDLAYTFCRTPRQRLDIPQDEAADSFHL